MTKQPPSVARRDAVRVAAALVLFALTGVSAWRFNHRPAPEPHLPQAPGYRIDVNAADVDTLQLLPGVGPSIAQNIVDRRETVGPFQSVEELEDVKMIGSILRTRMSPWVTLGGPTPSTRMFRPEAFNSPPTPGDDGGDAAPR